MLNCLITEVRFRFDDRKTISGNRHMRSGYL